MTTIDLEIDVSEAAELGERVHTTATVVLPDAAGMSNPPIVCFGFPGGGYSRHYFTFDMPGAEGGGQAGWHAARGWIFVACNHLGVGDSSLPPPAHLVYRNTAAANHATVREVLRRLAAGTLNPAFPAIQDPVVLAVGQSLGGFLLVVQQARHESFDGIGVLGYSAIHTQLQMPPGYPPLPNPYIPREEPAGAAPPREELSALAVNAALLRHGARRRAGARTPPGPNPNAWVFHYDDVPEEIVRRDMTDYPARGGDLPVWGSATMPGVALWALTPGAIAPEAAAVVVPVLLAFGERDVLADPWMEPKAYGASVDISLFVCPRMAHMHNFAGTRELLWSRTHVWGQHVAELKRRLPADWPSQLIS